MFSLSHTAQGRGQPSPPPISPSPHPSAVATVCVYISVMLDSPAAAAVSGPALGTESSNYHRPARQGCQRERYSGSSVDAGGPTRFTLALPPSILILRISLASTASLLLLHRSPEEVYFKLRAFFVFDLFFFFGVFRKFVLMFLFFVTFFNDVL